MLPVSGAAPLVETAVLTLQRNRRQIVTIMIGARCEDGVVLVSDRRVVRTGGLEPQLPACKLRAIGGLLVGRVGMFAFHDAVERLSGSGIPQSAWDMAQAADEIARQYEGFKDERPIFPVVDKLDGKAALWQVTGGFPPGSIEYEAWGAPEAYGAMGRLFRWQQIPSDTAWRVMLIMVALAAEVSLGVGDGADVGIVRDNTDGIEIREHGDPELVNAYRKASGWVDKLPGTMIDLMMGSGQGQTLKGLKARPFPPDTREDVEESMRNSGVDKVIKQQIVTIHSVLTEDT